jgi:hypothetical protein
MGFSNNSIYPLNTRPCVAQKRSNPTPAKILQVLASFLGIQEFDWPVSGAAVSSYQRNSSSPNHFSLCSIPNDNRSSTSRPPKRSSHRGDGDASVVITRSFLLTNYVDRRGMPLKFFLEHIKTPWVPFNAFQQFRNRNSNSTFVLLYNRASRRQIIGTLYHHASERKSSLPCVSRPPRSSFFTGCPYQLYLTAPIVI